jgi:hypothetical protein
MSFYSDASLVMIPSGYKDQKVYCAVPTDGSADLTFSRASSATRVASNGLIEKVRTNLLLQSQTFENASWAKVGVGTGLAAVVTANAGAAPDGTTTADRIVFNTGAGTTSGDRSIFRQSVVITEGSNLSFYIKSNTGSSQSIGFHNGAQIDIVTATTSWQRFSVNVSSAVTFVGLENRGDNATAGTCDVLVWGAQLQNGDIATDYIVTTTAAVSVGPVANVPRLDYLGSSCPRLLLEPQRTNLVFYSEQLNDAGWAAGAVVTANTAVSPDGYTNADSVMEAGINDYQIIGDPVTTTSGTAYTYSFFAKPNGRNFARILFGNGSFPDDKSAYFNLLTGEVSAASPITASMVSYGNGWYRCIATLTSDANATDAVYFGPARNMTDGYLPYVGNTSAGIYAYGAQQEAGAYATSYIPTLGASVTRVADAASKTGISSLIGQTEGTLFAEFTTSGLPATDQYFFNLSDGTTTNIIYLGFYSTIFVARVIDAGSLGCNINVGLAENTTYKIAFAYKANDCKLYINGVDSGTDTSVIIPAVSQFGMNEINLTAAYKVNQALLFKTRLTNSQLAELTA